MTASTAPKKAKGKPGPKPRRPREPFDRDASFRIIQTRGGKRRQYFGYGAVLLVKYVADNIMLCVGLRLITARASDIGPAIDLITNERIPRPGAVTLVTDRGFSRVRRFLQAAWEHNWLVCHDLLTTHFRAPAKPWHGAEEIQGGIYVNSPQRGWMHVPRNTRTAAGRHKWREAQKVRDSLYWRKQSLQTPTSVSIHPPKARCPVVMDLEHLPPDHPYWALPRCTGRHGTDEGCARRNLVFGMTHDNMLAIQYPPWGTSLWEHLYYPLRSCVERYNSYLKQQMGWHHDNFHVRGIEKVCILLVATIVCANLRLANPSQMFPEQIPTDETLPDDDTFDDEPGLSQVLPTRPVRRPRAPRTTNARPRGRISENARLRGARPGHPERH